MAGLMACLDLVTILLVWLGWFGWSVGFRNDIDQPPFLNIGAPRVLVEVHHFWRAILINRLVDSYGVNIITGAHCLFSFIWSPFWPVWWVLLFLGLGTLPPTNMEVQKGPFQEESSSALSAGVCAPNHASWCGRVPRTSVGFLQLPRRTRVVASRFSVLRLGVLGPHGGAAAFAELKGKKRRPGGSLSWLRWKPLQNLDVLCSCVFCF